MHQRHGGGLLCDGIDLLSNVSHSALGTSFVNDIWGWTDPKNKDDYTLVGASNGTVFVDISDAKRPQVLGILPTASTVGGSSWRDIKVCKDHAYVVPEHTNDGIQVFDLTRLRDWDGTSGSYDADARYTGHGSAYNININEDTGFLHSLGAGPFSSRGRPNTVTIDAPSSAAATYGATGAAFGPATVSERPVRTVGRRQRRDGDSRGLWPAGRLPGRRDRDRRPWHLRVHGQGCQRPTQQEPPALSWPTTRPPLRSPWVEPIPPSPSPP